MKKAVVVVVVLLALVVWLVLSRGPEEAGPAAPGEGEGAGPPSVTEAGEISFMIGGSPREFSWWEKILDRFEAKTGVTVNMVRLPADTDQKKQSMLLALRAEQADPDVLLMDVAWIGQMAAADWLEPLDARGVDAAAYFPKIVDLADTHQRDLIALPVYVDAGMLYYRTDLLESYGFDGPPETWSELRDMAAKVQAGERDENPDFWGYVWQGAQYEGLICNALEVFVSAGGGFFDDRMRPVVDSAPNRRALAYMVSLVQDAEVSPPNTYTDMKEEEVRILFQNGNACFERNWPYARRLHAEEDSAVQGRFGMATLPSFPDHESASTLGGWHMGVSRFSDNKDAAARFVEFVTSYGTQKDMLRELGLNPGRPDVYEDEELLTEEPALRTLRDVFMQAVPRPQVPYYSAVSAVLQNHINAALAGQESPDEALAAAQREIEEIVRDHAQ